jgi:hypothetical protein
MAVDACPDEAEGKTKPEILRLRKRYLARELYPPGSTVNRESPGPAVGRLTPVDRERSIPTAQPRSAAPTSWSSDQLLLAGKG